MVNRIINHVTEGIGRAATEVVESVTHVEGLTEAVFDGARGHTPSTLVNSIHEMRELIGQGPRWRQMLSHGNQAVDAAYSHAAHHTRRSVAQMREALSVEAQAAERGFTEIAAHAGAAGKSWGARLTQGLEDALSRVKIHL